MCQILKNQLFLPTILTTLPKKQRGKLNPHSGICPPLNNLLKAILKLYSAKDARESKSSKN